MIHWVSPRCCSNPTQIVHPDDISRFQLLGVGASFQPYWTYADEYVTLFNHPRVGPGRI